MQDNMTMKKLILLILLIISSHNIWSDQTINVGLMDNVPPISFMDKDSKPSGIFSDLLIEMLKDEEIKINWVHKPFPELYDLIINKEIDLLGGIVKTPEREKFIKFNSIPALMSWSQIFIAPGNDSIENILDLKDKTVGLMNQDQNGINFINLANSFNLSYDVKYYNTYEELTDGILNEEVNAGAFFSLYALYHSNLVATNIIFEPGGSYYGVPKDREDLYYLLDIIDAHLEEWLIDPNSFYYSDYNKYFKTIEIGRVSKLIYYIIGGISFITILLYLWSLFLRNRLLKKTTELQSAESKFKNLYDTMNQAVVYFSQDLEILDANPSAEHLFDVSIKDSIGLQLAEFLGKYGYIIIYEDGTQIQYDDMIIVRAIKNKQRESGVFGISNKNKDFYKWVDCSVVPEFNKDDGINRIYATFNDITDLKLALDKIEEREEESQTIIDNMSSGFAYHKMLYDKNGKAYDYEFIKTNTKFHELTSLDEDIIGRTLKNLNQGLENDEANWMELYGDVATTRIPKKIEIYSTVLEKWLDIAAYSPKDGYFATIFNDITDRKNSEQILKASEDALRENQKRLSITFESIGDGVIAVDTNFRVTMMNKVAKDILMWESGYYGMDLDQVLNVKNINIEGHSIKEISEKVLLEKKPFYINQAELHIEKEDIIKIVEDSISPIFNDEVVYGLVIVFRDITDKVNAKNKTQDLENQLNQSQKMDSIGQFSGGIAHNFNNIITAINGYISLIETSVERNKENFKYLNEINEIKLAANKASNLISQLLTVSRRQATNPEILDVNNVLSDLITMMKSIVGEDIVIDTKLNSRNKIKVDQNQVEQIILNFVANAKDAMKGEILVKENKILIETSDLYVSKEYSKQHIGINEGNYVIISFSDTGCGISEEIQDKIFDPFFTTKEIGKGTGLGLSTVYGIVKQNKADIFVESEIGEGTTFKIYWPATVEEKNKDHVISPTFKNIKGNENILFVEDEPTLQDLAKQFLTSYGYNVIVADDGQDGFNKFCETNYDIDMVITDVVMPNMSGSDLYKKMIEMKPDIKILFTSGYTKDHSIDDKPIHENGDINFLSKPYSLKLLAQKIREILDN